MNDARSAAGGAGGKVMLLDQQGAAAGAGALPSDRHAIDPAANDDDLEPLAFQAAAGLGERSSYRNQAGTIRVHSIACPGLGDWEKITSVRGVTTAGGFINFL